MSTAPLPYLSRISGYFPAGSVGHERFGLVRLGKKWNDRIARVDLRNRVSGPSLGKDTGEDVSGRMTPLEAAEMLGLKTGTGEKFDNAGSAGRVSASKAARSSPSSASTWVTQEVRRSRITECAFGCR